MELYRKELKLAVIKGLDESRGSSNVPIKLTHDTSDEYINYTEQIHIRYLFDNQVKEEILPTNDNGFYIPGKPLSHDGPIELAVHLINGNIELVTNELSFVVKNAPNGTTQVDPSEFTWQQLVDQYVNAKLDTFANKLDLSKFEETVNGSIENQRQNIESFKTEVNANLSNQDKKITDLQNTTKVSLDSQNTKIDNFKSEVNTSLSNQNTSINQTTSAQNSKITTLESRMDTFTRLSEGSTTGDAELQDIRVGANGITYDTAGNAVRGQYSQLKEDLENFIKKRIVVKNDKQRLIYSDLRTEDSVNYYTSLPIKLNVGKYKIDLSAWSNVSVVTKCTENGTPIEMIVVGNENGSSTYTFTLIEECFVTFCYSTGTLQPIYLYTLDTTDKNKEFLGYKWCCIGDSLTEHNIRTTKNYEQYVSESTGIKVVNLGVSGTGYKAGNNFYARVQSIPLDSDVVTIFGSGNDLSTDTPLGNVTDTGFNTLCGCINETIDAIINRIPTVNLGIVTPTPWKDFPPTTPNNSMDLYSHALVEICKRRSIPCLDLYHCSNLRPWTKEGRDACYSKDGGNGVHPNEQGHKLIAPRFKALLESLIL